MYMMFRKGMAASMLSAILAYGIWIVLQGQMSGSGVTSGMKMPIDAIILLFGAALLVSSYGYSRRNRLLPGETAHD
ncbi:hypothetical protein [Paenibacillus sp. DMB20]|uniref:hypothetical protein n=1 Tax=Paenibacillus sp. DMB20 TaxID=1642570 RepID=UPI001F32738D|nr:hypothetical protein [Paenibacillus sp. DMB20]